jgi:hypothetical protein
MAGRQPSHRAGRVARLFRADRFDVWVMRERENDASSLGRIGSAGVSWQYPVELPVKPVRSGRF